MCTVPVRPAMTLDFWYSPTRFSKKLVLPLQHTAGHHSRVRAVHSLAIWIHLTTVNSRASTRQQDWATCAQSDRVVTGHASLRLGPTQHACCWCCTNAREFPASFRAAYRWQWGRRQVVHHPHLPASFTGYHCPGSVPRQSPCADHPSMSRYISLTTPASHSCPSSSTALTVG